MGIRVQGKAQTDSEAESRRGGMSVYFELVCNAAMGPETRFEVGSRNN